MVINIYSSGYAMPDSTLPVRFYKLRVILRNVKHNFWKVARILVQIFAVILYDKDKLW